MQCLGLSVGTTTTTTKTTVLRPFVRDYPGEPVPEETLTHPPSWSSSNLYHLLPSTTIHSILLVEITCLAIFCTTSFHVLSRNGNGNEVVGRNGNGHQVWWWEWDGMWMKSSEWDGMWVKSWEWEEIGMMTLFPHTSTSMHRIEQVPVGHPARQQFCTSYPWRSSGHWWQKSALKWWKLATMFSFEISCIASL